jgi:hypothetical protein
MIHQLSWKKAVKQMFSGYIIRICFYAVYHNVAVGFCQSNYYSWSAGMAATIKGILHDSINK